MPWPAPASATRNDRFNPDVEIFASLKLDGARTFPSWLDSTTTGNIVGNTVNKPIASKYAQLLADFVEFMDDEGYQIDFLGPNNETGGAVEPWRFAETIRLLDDTLISRGVPADVRDFQYVGADTFGVGPQNNGWDKATSFIDTMVNQNRIDEVDIIGSHFYPQNGSGHETDWETLSALSGGKSHGGRHPRWSGRLGRLRRVAGQSRANRCRKHAIGRPGARAEIVAGAGCGPDLSRRAE